MSSQLLSLEMKPRSGPVPECLSPADRQTRSAFVHRQLTQLVHPSYADRLVAAMGRFPGVAVRDTLISIDGALAAHVDGVPDAPGRFMRGHEYFHVHPDGSSHLALPNSLHPRLVRAGWGLPHPLVSDTLLLYAPRNERELDLVASVAGARLADLIAAGGRVTDARSNG